MALDLPRRRHGDRRGAVLATPAPGPGVGRTTRGLDALRDHMATSVEHTLLALVRWIAERGDSTSP
ncbi:hypothetical protein OG288_36690 [Streptomyces tauricus]|uniref:Uncharacterized protein n=1 Tax=Streptomyces tauricus TaxID=68274 RepID=A0ABZ1JP25_9ACTN|nr:hypothetical protein [Streptomyces tauricus]